MATHDVLVAPDRSIADAIATQGFHHEPAFLTADELAQLRRFHGELAGTGAPGPVTTLSHDDLHRHLDRALIEKIHRVIGRCFPGLEFIFTDGLFFRVSKGDRRRSVNYAFHQDHESFLIYQDHSRYLNFYLVIDKDDPAHSNLTVVPFDELRRRDPTLHEIVAGAGATTFRNGELLSADVGSRHRYQTDLDAIAVTPALRAGDLLLLRGDIIHRTQDQHADRVALSIRCVYKRAISNRRNWTKISHYKLAIVTSNLSSYAAYDYLFTRAGTDYLTAEEIVTEWPRVQRQIDSGGLPGYQKHRRAFTARAFLLLFLCKVFRIGTRPAGAAK